MEVISLENLIIEEVSHAAGVMKQVFVRNGRIPGVTNFSRATLQPGQITDPHSHKDMIEVFYVESGTALFILDGQHLESTSGTCIIVDRNEEHSIENQSKAPVVLLYFGIECP